jgi:hypothetical protein
MRGLVLVFACGAGMLAFMAVSYIVQSIGDAAAPDKERTASPARSPNSQVSLFVRGWNQTELDRILTDYFRLHQLTGSSVWRIAAAPNRTLMITFARDIGPKPLFCLISYIRYPNNSGMSHRPVGVLGHLVLTAPFDVPDAALLGKRAVIYVSANESEYNVIYAKVESGNVYTIHLRT